MIGIKIKNEFLDLYPDSAITFELNNTALLQAENIDLKPTSYSFPINIPLSNKNRRLIGHADRLDTPGRLMENEPCEIYFNNFLFQAKATVTNSRNTKGNRQARLYMIMNPASDLKEFNLNEIDLGGYIDIDDPSPTAYAKDTATNPLDYSHIFFPVYNPRFFEGNDADPGTWESRFQNFYDATAGNFSDSSNQLNATPFIRAEYLIDQIFAHAGINYIDEWITDDELRKLCLYNNRSIYVAGTWPGAINLQNHVPEIVASQWLADFLTGFGVGIFPNPFNNTIVIKPIKDVILEPHKHDWTDKSAYTLSITNLEEPFKGYRYAADDDDRFFDMYVPLPDAILPILGSVTTLNDVPIDLTGQYYVEDQNAYYNRSAIDFIFQGKEYKAANPGYVSGEFYENPYPPIFQSFYPLSFDGGSGTVYAYMPHCEILGTFGDEENDYLPRPMFYRGFYPDSNGDDYPYANNQAYTPDGTLSYAHSLLYDGDRNLFTKSLQELTELTQNGKIVERKLNLTITDLLNFNLNDKVLIGRTHFLVKRLRITFKQNRIETTATLITL